MTGRSVHDDPVDDTRTTADIDTHVGNTLFKHPSTDIVPELFPAEPTVADAGTGGTLGQSDNGLAASS